MSFGFESGTIKNILLFLLPTRLLLIILLMEESKVTEQRVAGWGRWKRRSFSSKQKQ